MKRLNMVHQTFQHSPLGMFMGTAKMLFFRTLKRGNIRSWHPINSSQTIYFADRNRVRASGRFARNQQLRAIQMSSRLGRSEQAMLTGIVAVFDEWSEVVNMHSELLREIGDANKRPVIWHVDVNI